MSGMLAEVGEFVMALLTEEQGLGAQWSVCV